MTIIHKATVQPSPSRNPLEFVMSDDTRDRMGDVIDPKGWQLSNFKRNPMALFNHNSNFPIGHWENVRVEGNKLVGNLKLAAKGTSDRIDEIISLVEQGILRAVSVGFSALKSEALKDDSGILFKRQELLETSLVSIPANPAAVQLAKSLDISDDTIGLVFGVQAKERLALMGHGIPGVQAKSNPTNGISKMENLDPKARVGLQIQDNQARLIGLQDTLSAKVADLDNGGDNVQAEIENLNSQISATNKTLAILKQTEASLANHVAANPQQQTQQAVTYTAPARDATGSKVWAAPAKKLEAFDHVVRAAVCTALGHYRHQSPLDVMKAEYGEDRTTKAVMDVVTRAASAPALTTTTGWAAELVTTAYLDIIETLVAQSVYPKLAAEGGKFTFGRNGIVSIPARSTSTTVAGSFVGQGAAIPVRQGAFTATTLTVKKLGVITTFSREMAEHSTPQIEQVLRQAIIEDTSVAVDTVLLDATAASAIRPAGLKNGVSGQTATTGGGYAAVVGDIKLLVGALITGSNGHLRKPVWIMNPAQALSLQLAVNAQGVFLFADQIARGQFQGYPLILSATVPAGTVFLLDAADFFSATGDAPVFTASDQATLHMEDTTPLALSATGSPNTVAAPIRSLYQTDSLAIRMTLDMNWAMRRTGTIAWVSSITW